MLKLIPTLAGLPLAFALVAAPGLPIWLRPDAFLWSVVFLSLFTWSRQSCMPVIGLGLLQDTFSLTPLGAHAVLYVMIFRLLHKWRHGVYRDSVPTQIGVCLAAALVSQSLMVSGLILTGAKIPLAMAAVSMVLIALPTTLLAPLTFGITSHHAWHVGTPVNRDGEFML